jgi:hypothetical protein
VIRLPKISHFVRDDRLFSVSFRAHREKSFFALQRDPFKLHRYLIFSLTGEIPSHVLTKKHHGAAELLDAGRREAKSFHRHFLPLRRVFKGFKIIDEDFQSLHRFSYFSVRVHARIQRAVFV